MSALLWLWLGGTIAATLIWVAETVDDGEAPSVGGYFICALWPIATPLLVYIVMRDGIER